VIKMNLYCSRPKKVQHPDDVLVCECDRLSGCSSSNCINKLMFVECDPKWCKCGENCQNTRFSRRQYADVGLMQPTGPKGYGLMTNQGLNKGDFVMEYVGEVISEDEYFQRKVDYQRSGRRHYYFMSIANGEVIDATRKGNLSRFLNHSCRPNCETQKWQVGAELSIGIFALRDIAAGEELTFDYHFERDGDQAMKCLCGEPCCRGFIGSSSDEAAIASSSSKSDFTIHNISSVDYNVNEEPRPVMEEAPESVYQNTAQSARKSSATKKRRSTSNSNRQQQQLLLSQPVIRRRTEAERILHEVTNVGGGLKDLKHVLDVLRIMNANYSRFELSMMFDVVLNSPTKAIKQEFVKLNALGALQVLMNKFRTSEEEKLKLFVPLLRKALDVTQCLPVSKSILCKTKTATSSFATLLVDLASHSDAEVAEKASKICEKHLAEELVKKKEEEAAQNQNRMMTSRTYSSRHSHSHSHYGHGHSQSQSQGKENTKATNGNGALSEHHRGSTDHRAGGYRRMSDTYKYEDSRKNNGNGNGYHSGYQTGGNGNGGDNRGDWHKKRARDEYDEYHEHERSRHHTHAFSSRSESRQRDYGGADYYDDAKRHNSSNNNNGSVGRFHAGSADRLDGHHRGQYEYDHRGAVPSHQPPPPPPPQQHTLPASASALPSSNGNHKSNKHAGARRFKEITDSHIWTSPSEDFKDVVRQIIEYRVKKLAQQKAQSLYKDKEKMKTIIGKLYNRVMKKEEKNLDGKNFTLHSDLVKKVDSYTRSHLKAYCA
jgi:histone-lysine N-methyltransferase SETD2